MNLLANTKTRKGIYRALGSLPRNLDALYSGIISKIWGQNEEDVLIASDVLSWVSFVKRPLTITELQHALAITSKSIELDEDALVDPEIMLSVCWIGHHPARNQHHLFRSLQLSGIS
jgi:hypothetical protein